MFNRVPGASLRQRGARGSRDEVPGKRSALNTFRSSLLCGIPLEFRTWTQNTWTNLGSIRRMHCRGIVLVLHGAAAGAVTKFYRDRESGIDWGSGY